MMGCRRCWGLCGGGVDRAHPVQHLALMTGHLLAESNVSAAAVCGERIWPADFWEHILCLFGLSRLTKLQLLHDREGRWSELS